MFNRILVMILKPEVKQNSKKTNFGNWDIIVNIDSKKDSIFIISYKIGCRINEIENIYVILY